MNVVYAHEPIVAHSIFLAGPTPRDKKTSSWRPEALNLLDSFNYKGTVYVPEKSCGESWTDHYDKQIDWEWRALSVAKVVVFWIPRKLDTLPGFTTNVEFGLMAPSLKCVLLGCPKDAPKMKYLLRLANLYNIPVYHSLREILLVATEGC